MFINKEKVYQITQKAAQDGQDPKAVLKSLVSRWYELEWFKEAQVLHKQKSEMIGRWRAEKNFWQIMSTAASNLDDSALKLWNDTLHAIKNPVQTGKGLINVAAGTAQNALDSVGLMKWEDTNSQKTAKAFRKEIARPYSSKDEFIKTFEEDPLRIFWDVLTIVSGWAWAASKVGKLGQAWKLWTTIAKAWEAWAVTNGIVLADKIVKIADKANPYIQVIDLPLKWLSKALKMPLKWGQTLYSKLRDVLPGDLVTSAMKIPAWKQKGIFKIESIPYEEWVISRGMVWNFDELTTMSKARKESFMDIKKQLVDWVDTIITTPDIKLALDLLKKVESGRETMAKIKKLTDANNKKWWLSPTEALEVQRLIDGTSGTFKSDWTIGATKKAKDFADYRKTLDDAITEIVNKDHDTFIAKLEKLENIKKDKVAGQSHKDPLVILKELMEKERKAWRNPDVMEIINREIRTSTDLIEWTQSSKFRDKNKNDISFADISVTLGLSSYLGYTLGIGAGGIILGTSFVVFRKYLWTPKGALNISKYIKKLPPAEQTWVTKILEWIKKGEQLPREDVKRAMKMIQPWLEKTVVTLDELETMDEEQTDTSLSKYIDGSDNLDDGEDIFNLGDQE